MHGTYLFFNKILEISKNILYIQFLCIILYEEIGARPQKTMHILDQEEYEQKDHVVIHTSVDAFLKLHMLYEEEEEDIVATANNKLKKKKKKLSTDANLC